MRMILACLALLPTFALAAPVVVTSIRPVFDLTAQVMQGVGEPVALLAGTASPHHAELRPSGRRALGEAELVISVGLGLEPWLEHGLEAAGPRPHLVLAAVEGVKLLPIRQPATLAAAEEQEAALGEAGHGAEPKGESDADFFQEESDDLEAVAEAEAIAAEAAADLAAEAEFGGGADESHDHEAEEGQVRPATGMDPHIWLDPGNARLFLDAIAAELSRIDPENAVTYRANAEEAKLDLAEALLTVRDLLAEETDTRFVFNHDTFQYFEAAFGLKSLGSMTTAHGQVIGARSVAEVEDAADFAPVLCVIIDQAESSRSVKNLFPRAKSAVLGPLGHGLDEADPYPARLFLALAEGFGACG
jgi:zinc transport system substrate-binding protein